MTVEAKDNAGTDSETEMAEVSAWCVNLSQITRVYNQSQLDTVCVILLAQFITDACM